MPLRLLRCERAAYICPPSGGTNNSPVYIYICLISHSRRPCAPSLLALPVMLRSSSAFPVHALHCVCAHAYDKPCRMSPTDVSGRGRATFSCGMHCACMLVGASYGWFVEPRGSVETFLLPVHLSCGHTFRPTHTVSRCRVPVPCPEFRPGAGPGFRFRVLCRVNLGDLQFV